MHLVQYRTKVLALYSLHCVATPEKVDQVLCDIVETDHLLQVG